MAQAPKNQRAQREVRNGRAVDPAALEAFYRHRSESLTRSNQVQGQQTTQMQNSVDKGQPNGTRPTQGILEYVISALQGHPGFVNK